MESPPQKNKGPPPRVLDILPEYKGPFLSTVLYRKNLKGKNDEIFSKLTIMCKSSREKNILFRFKLDVHECINTHVLTRSIKILVAPIGMTRVMFGRQAGVNVGRVVRWPDPLNPLRCKPTLRPPHRVMKNRIWF